jgi:hypothetical protein
MYFSGFQNRIRTALSLGPMIEDIYTAYFSKNFAEVTFFIWFFTMKRMKTSVEDPGSGAFLTRIRDPE